MGGSGMEQTITIDGFSAIGLDPVEDEGRRGLRSRDAAQALGAEVELAPSDAPREVQLAAIRGFLQLALAGGNIVPDGDTFGPETGTFTCRVAHLATDIDEPRYRLTIEALDEEALIADPDDGAPATAAAVATPALQPGLLLDDDPDRPLDPKDPMDAAILRRLAEREGEMPEPEIAEAPAAPTPAAPAGVKRGFGRRRAEPRIG